MCNLAIEVRVGLIEALDLEELEFRAGMQGLMHEWFDREQFEK